MHNSFFFTAYFVFIAQFMVNNKSLNLMVSKFTDFAYSQINIQIFNKNLKKSFGL